MKIAVLFRGPTRPSPAHTRSYVSKFLENFKSLDLKPTTYLATWRPDSVDEDFVKLMEREIDNVISLELPTKEFIGEDLFDKFLPSAHRTRNMFYQHFSSKIAVGLIADNYDYDVIFHTRTDLYVNFGDKFSIWLDPSRFDKYQAMHIRDVHPGSYLNDQLGVSSPSVMKRAWDYGSLANLKSKIHHIYNAGGRAEDLLQSIADDAGVEITWGPVVTYYLDAERHLRTGM